MLILIMGLSQCFLYSFPFLEVEPKYKCLQKDGTWTPCDSIDFCHNPEQKWDYIWEDNETINNLIIQFHLECATAVELGLIGSSFLAGIVVGSVTVTRIGDLFGRRPGFILGLIV